jgi:hypothetical protein
MLSKLPMASSMPMKKGMIHRDIKPANLMLYVDREKKRHVVKILDFGLAKMSSEHGFDSGLTGEGRMLGTPDYIAPEQILDAKSADIRADIYSLGCTLYFLLAGAPPFQATSLFELLRKHREEDAQPLNVVRPEIPVAAAAVVARMMAKDPAQRYPTPGAVAKALAPILAKANKPAPESQEEVSTTSVANGVAQSTASEQSVSPQKSKAVAIDLADCAESSIATKPLELPPAESPRRRLMWPVLGAGLLIALLAALAGSGVFSGRTRETETDRDRAGPGEITTATTKEGVVVLKILPLDAELLVDGEKVTVQSAGGDKFNEIQLEPGKKHKLEIKRAGFKTESQEVELAAGERKQIDIRLEPVLVVVAQPAAPEPKVTAAPTPVDKKEPKIASKWMYTNPSNNTFPITLYANGHFMTPDGVPTWELRGNVLFLRWGGSNPRSPVDRCVLSPDGKSFHGENQAHFKMSGKKILE